jgi:uncharacterized membrane protein
MFDFLLLLSAIIVVVIDSVYLTLVAPYFKYQVKLVQNSPMVINYLGAVLSYIFIIVGLNYFIIKPRKSPQDAFLLGIVIYGIFEATNLALFKNWLMTTVILDTLWGGILFALTTIIVEKIRKLF